MTNSRLTDEDLDTLGALRRVGEPECPVTEVDGRYYYRGHPVVPWLQRPLATLVAAGLVTLADPGPAGFQARRATLTAAGYARYEQLRAGLQDRGCSLHLPGCGQR
jgi:hypothetical protein